MSVALERYDMVVQPLWPVVPSSLYGAFLAREETDALVLVITFDTIVHGRRAVLHTSPDEPGRVQGETQWRSCGFIINHPAASRARSWRLLRRGDGCPAAVALAIRHFSLFGGTLGRSERSTRERYCRTTHTAGSAGDTAPPQQGLIAARAR